MTETLSESEFDSGQSQPDKITILLAEDHPLMRQALRNVMEEQPDFEIVAEAGDGEEAVRMANELVPNIVIMDISMPKLNGLEATRQIKAAHPSIGILVLTVHDSSEYLLGILEAGAAGYLTKAVFGDQIIHAIRGVVAGDTVLSRQVSQQILKYALRYPTRPLPLHTVGELTVRELDILKLASTGMHNKDIALKMGLNLRTVKGHLAEIFSKLEVGSRTEAVIVGLRAGFLTIDDLE